MANYGQHLNPSNTPQSAPLPGRAAEMVKNPAGGYTFNLDDWQRLRRFLILGAEGGSYYESEKKLVLENADALQRCLKEDGHRVVNLILEVSDKGLAPKNDPAIFALALATKFGDEKTRQHAFKVMPAVCRIGTHLFQFAEARQQIGGGWGVGMRKAVSEWYNRGDLVLQALKFQQRNGWSHADMLRLAHPQAQGEQHKLVFDAMVRSKGGPAHAPGKKGEPLVQRGTGAGWEAVAQWNPLAEGYLKVQKASTAQEAAALITQYKLPREFVPTQFLTEAPVWDALLPHMPLHALVRNLGNLSKSGLLMPLSNATGVVVQKLLDPENIKRSRLHPFNVLLAQKTYASGRSVKGSGTWTVVPQVVGALDQTFNKAFQNVQPTGKRFMMGIDVSASMSTPVNGSLSAAEAASAMAMATIRTEEKWYAMGFSDRFVDLKITATESLPSILARTRHLTGNSTDCAMTINWAKQHLIPVDVFVIYSDGESWAGDIHAARALEVYRKEMNIPAKLAAVNFTATGRSVADPKDGGSMNFVGMDASLPQALAAFVTE